LFAINVGDIESFKKEKIRIIFSGKSECGGSLKYVQNLDDHVVDEVDPTIG